VWPGFDHFVGMVADLNLLKGGVFLALLAWIWCQPAPGQERRRSLVVATLVGSFSALAVARMLAVVLPFRLRPMLAYHTADAPPIAPEWNDWSSFPSDHATWFVALASGLWLASHRIGGLALAYAVVVICLPRLYIGYHYFSDVIAGAALGAVITWFACRPRLREPISRPLLHWGELHPAPFYAAAVLLCFEMATLFEGVRTFGAFVAARLH
jgi:undecaprenyl-diphosphatase